jgi:anthranilate phosphoribosyltransferase
VLLNSAAGLIVADKVSSLTDGAETAARVLDQGDALLVLDKLIEISNG